MQYEEKLKLLRSLHLLKGMPERQLTGLAEFLRPKQLEDGAPVFQEGSIGMSLYFISSGHIRIHMKLADGSSKDLAILGAGDFFGEMALIEEACRTASASAVGPTVLFELFRGDLSRWVKLNSQQAVQFFAGLVHLQSQRLRRTSGELALQTDLANLLGTPGLDPAGFLAKTVDCVLPRLEGPWAGAAYLCDASGGLLPAALKGDLKPEAYLAKLPSATAASWLDESTFHVPLSGHRGPVGHLLFSSKSPGAKDEIGRALTGIARLVATGVEVAKPH